MSRLQALQVVVMKLDITMKLNVVCSDGSVLCEAQDVASSKVLLEMISELDDDANDVAEISLLRFGSVAMQDFQ